MPPPLRKNIDLLFISDLPPFVCEWFFIWCFSSMFPLQGFVSSIFNIQVSRSLHSFESLWLQHMVTYCSCCHSANYSPKTSDMCRHGTFLYRKLDQCAKWPVYSPTPSQPALIESSLDKNDYLFIFYFIGLFLSFNYFHPSFWRTLSL